MIELIEPTKAYKESFLDAVKKHKQSTEKDGAFDAHDTEWFFQHFETLLETYRHEKKGDVEEGRVPATEFWVVSAGKWLGRFSLRHRLNDALQTYGGHLGYYLIPEARNKGIGTQAMSQVLVEAKRLGLTKLLITCDEDNAASQKLIQKYGGVHQDTIRVPQTKKPLMRWWLSLEHID